MILSPYPHLYRVIIQLIYLKKLQVQVQGITPCYFDICSSFFSKSITRFNVSDALTPYAIPMGVASIFLSADTNSFDFNALAIFSWLVTAGYETFDYEAGKDREMWKARQISLGMTGQQLDGIPGPTTIKALKEAGNSNGLWIK